MPDVHVQASTVIPAPVQRVHDTLVDFTTWPDWSPWLYIEPEAQVDYTGNKGEPGHGYQWAGNKVGAGSMKLSGVAPGRIDCTLRFLKPFKSTATVWFDLNESAPDQTTLTWSMHSQLPFFLFWMKDSMTAMIKADYKRGLALLNGLLTTGALTSQTRLQGMEDLDPISYVGHQVVTSIDQLPSSIPQPFSALAEQEKSGVYTSIGNAFCFDDKMVPKRNEITYTAAQPVVKSVSVAQPTRITHNSRLSRIKGVSHRSISAPCQCLGNANGRGSIQKTQGFKVDSSV